MCIAIIFLIMTICEVVLLYTSILGHLTNIESDIMFGLFSVNLLIMIVGIIIPTWFKGLDRYED